MLDTGFDLDLVRRQFPGLNTEWTLFDNAGGTVPCRQVIERVVDYLEKRCVQLGGTYRLSAEATEAVAAGRRAVATLIGADEDEVVLGSSATMLVRTLSQALRPLWAEGDEVVVTDLDHEANSGAWRRLAKTGIAVREWRFNRESLRLELEDLEPLLNDRTRLVCFTHCSNLIGTIHAVAPMIRRVHEAGALTCVDGVAYGPHRRIDVKALGADFYFASLYKIFGPHQSFLFGRREHLIAAEGQNHFFFGPEAIPDKLEPGAPNHELCSALPGILDYLAMIADDLDTAFRRVAEHEGNLAAPLLEFLDAHPRVRLIGSADPDPLHRAPTVSFAVDGRHASEIPLALDERNLAARWGDFYAPRAIRALELEERGGVVRVSMVHYNTPDEVARLLEELDLLL